MDLVLMRVISGRKEWWTFAPWVVQRDWGGGGEVHRTVSRAKTFVQLRLVSFHHTHKVWSLWSQARR